MADYFVRRTLGWNRKTYPEIWYDCDVSPTKSIEHAGKIKHAHIITPEDLAAHDAHNEAGNGYSRGQPLSLVAFLNQRYPEKVTDDAV